MTKKTEEKEYLQDMQLSELFAALDEILQTMQTDVSLEESFSLYHHGMELLKMCNDKIDTVEKKMLVLDEEGYKHEF